MIEFKEKLELDITQVNLRRDVVNFLEPFDFNRLFFLADRNEEQFTSVGEHSCKLRNLQATKVGQDFESAIKNIFNYNGEKIDTYVFASFSKRGITPNHVDAMTVFLIPVYGDVVYNVYTEKEQHYFLVKKGDILTIPRDVVHSAIPLNPRIVISVGIYN